MARDELLVITSLPSVERQGAVRITRKMASGLERYVDLWGGPVRVVMPPAPDDGGTGNLDDVFLKRAELPFAVDILPLDGPALEERMRLAGVVLSTVDYRLNGAAARCRSWGVPFVYNTEYTLATRVQTALSESTNPLRTARRLLWEWQQERAVLRDVKTSTALQCNGTPTYEAYREHNRDSLLYFDTRTTVDMLPSEDPLRAKAARRASGAPLRLVYSGRLAKMKGVDDLPKVAHALRARGVDFVLDVCGAGPTEAAMRADVERRGLSAHVRFRGVLDFTRELVPMLIEDCDLFVCCHRQGDPACTYLETFATGVPIAGYGNEALEGLLRMVPAGFSVPLNQPDSLAAKIAELATPTGSEAITRAASVGLAFAREHTFEATFARRIAHLRALAARPAA